MSTEDRHHRRRRIEDHYEQVDDFKNPENASKGLFDLRKLIGSLFVFYGIVLTIAGFFTTDQARTKAGGININLWLGLAMLVLGILFWVWARTRPLRVEGRSAIAEGERGPTQPPGMH